MLILRNALPGLKHGLIFNELIARKISCAVVSWLLNPVAQAAQCLRLQIILYYARLGLAPTHIARPSIVTYNEDLYTSLCLSVC